MSGSPLSILEVREITGTAITNWQSDTVKLFEAFFFFNKKTSVAESVMVSVMLHNTDTKCE